VNENGVHHFIRLWDVVFTKPGNDVTFLAVYILWFVRMLSQLASMVQDLCFISGRAIFQKLLT
jgi:hypothetical protein